MLLKPHVVPIKILADFWESDLNSLVIFKLLVKERFLSQIQWYHLWSPMGPETAPEPKTNVISFFRCACAPQRFLWFFFFVSFLLKIFLFNLRNECPVRIKWKNTEAPSESSKAWRIPQTFTWQPEFSCAWAEGSAPAEPPDHTGVSGLTPFLSATPLSLNSRKKEVYLKPFYLFFGIKIVPH